MIDKDGNAKIMDFGIARSRTERAITGEGRVVGTPEYISPEQFEGAAADAQSDLYALGVILFEMTCGTFPFEGDTAQIIAQKIAGRRPPDPQTINPHVPNDLAKAILKCLEKRRDRRFGSANELLAELRRIESGLPTSERLMVKARSSVFTGLTRRLMKKRTLGILFGLAVCAVVAVLFTRPRGKAAPDGAAVLSVRPTLAVLFFANRTNDTELDYLRKNLCIKFISSLRQLAPDLPVRSHIDIYSQLKRLGLESGEYSADDLSEIARKLDVSHIMTGQLMKLGNIWQIYYELRDMASLALADSGQMNGKPEELDAIVAKLAENALQGLRIPVSGQVRAIGSRDPLANKLYAMARDAEINAVLSAEESEKDAQLSRMFQKLQEAIATDQAFAAAYWGLGDYYGLLYVANGRLKDLNLMKSNYERAYELDPQLAGANAGLGWARFYDEQMDDAFHCFLNALRLAPDDPEININIGSFLFSIGQIDSGIRYFTRAIEAGDESANPLGPLYRRAVSFFSIGKLAEADSDVREMIALESQDVALRILHARILAKMKRIDDANEELARIESLNPGNTDLLYVRACIRAAAGDGAEVLPLLERARKEDPLSRSYFLSENYAQLGMTDRAVEVIRDGIENGFSKVFFTLYPYQVLTNGSYERIRGDSRFMKILGERKKISDSQREKYRELCRPQPSR
jgi:tetratricopeptide (TPR) repeat protein